MKTYGLMTGPLMVNTYLADDEATGCCFIVDPGGYAQELTDTIKRNNYKPEYIILTHGHADHIGGVNRYREAFPDIRLVCSFEEVQLLGDADMNMSGMTLGEKVELTPDITVTDGETMMIGETEIRFAMTPGHTDGGMCIIAGDTVFSGDTLFRGSIGRTDFPGGSFEKITSSIQRKLYVLDDDTVVLPGHMERTTIGYEKRYNPFVRQN